MVKILPRQIKKLHVLHWQKPQKLRTAEVTSDPSLLPSFLWKIKVWELSESKAFASYSWNMVKQFVIISVIPRVFFGILVGVSAMYLSRTEGPRLWFQVLSEFFLNLEHLDWPKIHFPAWSMVFWQALF